MTNSPRHTFEEPRCLLQRSHRDHPKADLKGGRESIAETRLNRLVVVSCVTGFKPGDSMELNHDGLGATHESPLSLGRQESTEPIRFERPRLGVRFLEPKLLRLPEKVETRASLAESSQAQRAGPREEQAPRPIRPGKSREHCSTLRSLHHCGAPNAYVRQLCSQIRVGSVRDALRKRLPELKFILCNLESGHFLGRTGTLAGPEDQST